MSTKKKVVERTLLYSFLLKEALKRLIIEIRGNEDLFLRREGFAFPCLHSDDNGEWFSIAIGGFKVDGRGTAGCLQ